MRQRNILERLQDAGQPLLFVFFTYVLGIAVGSAQTVCENWFGAELVAIIGGIILGILLLAEVHRQFVRWLQASNRGSVLDVEKLVPNPPGHRGLIVVASRGEGISSARRAIEYHLSKGTLEKCWILTGGRESKESAQNMVGEFVQNGVRPDLFEYVELRGEEVDNPDIVCERVESIFENLPEGWSESDVAADYTGGTKSMTAGIVLACAKPGRHLQFMKPRAYLPDGRADSSAGSDTVLVDINYKVRPVGKRMSVRVPG